ncbi:MAG: bile acid:sodium symporter [Cyanobacteria bacterium P01_D01_bin.44]
MWKVFGFFQRNLVWSIPIFMVAGLIVGTVTHPAPLKTLIIPLTFLMVYPMMINLQVQKVLKGGDYRVQLLTQLINFGVIPFFAFGMGKLFFADRPLVALGLLLASLLPTSGMTISWTGFARGNISAAVKMTVIGLVLGSVATPFYAKWLMGTVVEIPLASIFKQIVMIVFLPMLLGIVTRLSLIRIVGIDQYNKNLSRKFPAFSTVGVLGIVFVAMALKAKDIVAHPWVLLSFLLPLAILYLINFLLSTIVGKLCFDRGDAIALVYGTVMRNLSIALAIAMTAFGKEQGSEIALIIAMAYIIQVQAAAWYVRFTDRIFGPAPELQPEIFRLQQSSR